MPSYSILPQTSQLIYNNPGQAGTQLFKRHGYNIRNPRHRDYYNALQTNGFDFFHDLLGTVTSLWGPGGALSKQSIPADYSRPAYDLNPGRQSGVNANTSQLRIPSMLGYTGAKGIANYDGKDKRHHVAAFQELVTQLGKIVAAEDNPNTGRHRNGDDEYYDRRRFRMRNNRNYRDDEGDRRLAYPLPWGGGIGAYSSTVVLSNGDEVAEPTQQTQNFDQNNAGEEKILGIRKNIFFIVLAIIAGLVLYKTVIK